LLLHSIRAHSFNISKQAYKTFCELYVSLSVAQLPGTGVRTSRPGKLNVKTELPLGLFFSI